MRDLKRKKSLRNFLESKVTLIVLFILLLLFTWNMIGFVGKMIETKKNRDIARKKVTELTETKEKLSQDINNLNTEKGQEESIREKFGFVKEGEGVVVIVEEKKEVNEAEEEEKESKFLNFLRNWFK